ERAALDLEPLATADAKLAPLILSARGNEGERRVLGEHLARLEARLASADWLAAKAAELAQMNRPEFWSDPARFVALSGIEVMDRIEAGLDTARSIMRRLETRAGRRNALPASLLSNLAQQLYLLECALQDLDGHRAADVFLGIEPVASDSGFAGGAPPWT